eukprot:g3458.t1
MDDAIAMIRDARGKNAYDKNPDIVRAMEKYKGNEKLQYEATWTLIDFASGNAENKKRIAKEGGIAAILRAMESHKMSEGVQEHGCWALKNLAWPNAENQKRIAKEGGIAAILRAMESHKTSEGVQQQGCRVLWSLAANNAENKKRIAKEGGIAAILRAMESHKSSEGVQNEGCGALRNLASNAENQKRIAKEGGIAAVLRAMESHKTSGGVQDMGCATIGNLAMDHINRSQLVDQHDCIDSILTAMKRFDDNLEVLKMSCWALYALAWQRPAHQTHIARVVGVTRIARALECISSDTEFQSMMIEKCGDDVIDKCYRSLDACLLAIDAFVKIPMKDIDARYALLVSLRTLRTQAEENRNR